jgi:hypothetical protein
MEPLKPEEAVEILRLHGVEITLEQAKQILELMWIFANIIVAQYERS